MTEPKPTKLPLLRSESSEEFVALRTKLNLTVRPQDAIEETLFEDFVAVIWEMKRIRGLQLSTIKRVYGEAFRKLLVRLLSETATLAYEAKARNLTRRWFEKDPAAEKEVAIIFSRFDVDEQAIEAEALALTLDQQQYYGRGLASASARRDKVLRTIMDYRGSDFAMQLRQKSDEILNEPQASEPGDGGDGEQKAAAA